MRLFAKSTTCPAILLVILSGGMVVLPLAANGAAGRQDELTETELKDRLEDTSRGLRQFISETETTIRAGDPKVLASKIDAEAILERATRDVGLEGTEQIKEVFATGTKKAWETNSLANDYAGTDFRFLRTRTFEGRSGLLFRSHADSGALNYYLFIMGEPRPGQYTVRDIFVLGLNEFTSDNLRRTYLHLVASFLGEQAKSLSANGKVFIDSIQDIANINVGMRDGQYAEALENWKKLPAAIQNERNILMIRIDAAEKVSPEERASAMEAWIKEYPNAAELPLKMADYYMATERWGEAKSLLESVMEKVGGDSRLLYQIGQAGYRIRQTQNWVNAARLELDKEKLVEPAK